MKDRITFKTLLKRKKETHKGDYGHILIVAGSRGMSGAAVLCGYGALRAGAGLVTIATPGSIQSTVASGIVEAMTLPLPETPRGTLHEDAIHQLVTFISKSKINSIVVGPGIGMDIESRMVVIGIINQVTCHGVLDADGLNQLAGNLAILKNSKGTWIMTPHPGELARLEGKKTGDIQKKRKQSAVNAAKKSGGICVLKGNHTVVTDGKKTIINSTGNPGMATGGSGDVLAGILGGFSAQGLDSFEAARWGVYVHGLAGDIAVKEKTEASLIARDIVEHIPHAFKKIIK